MDGSKERRRVCEKSPRRRRNERGKKKINRTRRRWRQRGGSRRPRRVLPYITRRFRRHRVRAPPAKGKKNIVCVEKKHPLGLDEKRVGDEAQKPSGYFRRDRPTWTSGRIEVVTSEIPRRRNRSGETVSKTGEGGVCVRKYSRMSKRGSFLPRFRRRLPPISIVLAPSINATATVPLVYCATNEHR